METSSSFLKEDDQVSFRLFDCCVAGVRFQLLMCCRCQSGFSFYWFCKVPHGLGPKYLLEPFIFLYFILCFNILYYFAILNLFLPLVFHHYNSERFTIRFLSSCFIHSFFDNIRKLLLCVLYSQPLTAAAG